MTQPHPDANGHSAVPSGPSEQLPLANEANQVPSMPQYQQQPQSPVLYQQPAGLPPAPQHQQQPLGPPQFQPSGYGQAPALNQYPQQAQPQHHSQLAQPQYQQQPQAYAAPPQWQPQYQQQPPAPNPAYGYPQPKSKIVAGLLGIFLGGLGIHRFYLGFTKIAVIQLILTLVLGAFTFGIVALWGVIEGIMIIAGSSYFQRDAHGTPLRD